MGRPLGRIGRVFRETLAGLSDDGGCSASLAREELESSS